MFSKSIIVAASSLVLLPMSTMAQIAEIRVGLAEFDERTTGDFPSILPSVQRANENSVAISGEILFEEPEFLKWALSPQPYVGGTLNLEGKTSFGGAGFLWRQTVGKKFYGDFAAGLAVHNGTTQIESSDELIALLNQLEGFQDPNDVPPNLLEEFIALSDERFDRFDNEIEFGSRVLFRLQGAIGLNINEDWAGEVYIEHLSNGDLFSKPRNDGVNNLGFRVARKF